MKTHEIILYDKAKKETTKIEDFPAVSITALRKRLTELQEAYCKGDEVPVVREEKISSDGFLIKALIARSNCDYWHIAAIENI